MLINDLKQMLKKKIYFNEESRNLSKTIDQHLFVKNSSNLNEQLKEDQLMSIITVRHFRENIPIIYRDDSFNWYINLDYIQENFKFSLFHLSKLMSNSRHKSLEGILQIFIDGMRYYSRSKRSEFNYSSDLESMIEQTKYLIETVNSLKLVDSFIIFKKKIITMQNSSSQYIYRGHLDLLKFIKEKKFKKSLFYINLSENQDKPFDNFSNLSRKQLQVVRKISENNFSKSVGIGGSGKTFSALQLLRLEQIVSAVVFAQYRINFPSYYISYSEKSIKSAEESYREIDRYNCINISNRESVIQAVESRLDSSDFDMNRLLEIENRLKSIIIPDQSVLESYIKPITTLSEIDLSDTVEKDLKKLEEIELPSGMFYRLFASYISYSNLELERLFNRYAIVLDDTSLKDYYILKEKLYEKLQGKIERVEKIKKNIKKLYSDNSFESVTIDYTTVSYDDVVYYNRYKYKLLDNQKDIEKRLKIAVETGKIEPKLVSTLFPVILTTLDRLSELPTGYRIVLDESYLLPAITAVDLVEKALNIYLTGDLNQKDGLLIPQSLLENIAEKTGSRELLLDSNSAVASAASLLPVENTEFYLESFRYSKNFTELLFSIEPSYEEYIKTYLGRQGVRVEEKAIDYIDHYRSDRFAFRYNDSIEISEIIALTPSEPAGLSIGEKRIFIEERLRKIFKILETSSNINSFLLTYLYDQPLQDLVERVKRDYKLDHIEFEVLHISLLQALESDFIFFELGAVNEKESSFKYINEKRKILNMIISRSRKAFAISYHPSLAEASENFRLIEEKAIRI